MYEMSFRAACVSELLNGTEPLRVVAAKCGIGHATLYRWSQDENLRTMAKSGKTPPRGGARSAEVKLQLVTEASRLSDEELGAFLRREGLHEEELAQLREEVHQAALAGLRGASKPTKPASDPVARKRIQKLEKKLLRKDKELKEAKALLVLQGKVQAFLASETDEEGELPKNDES